MIICRTPYRISFFGGGSDYPSWLKNNDGEVISTSINKYTYISCRFLPNFFDHKYRISYSQLEEVKQISKIKHYAVKKVLENHPIGHHGLEIHYDGDLPSNSGMGSSSSFIVGLLNSLNTLEYLNKQKKKINKRDLADLAIKYEQKVLKEIGGYQDQVITSHGGFNNINFYSKKKYSIKKININEKSTNDLNNNLFLVYSGIKRYAHKIAGSFVSNLNNTNKDYIIEILNHVKIAKTLLKNKMFDDFGRLLNESWLIKKKLSRSISNKRIDEIYKYCLNSGALGGKLLGAGGGGFFVFYVPKDKHKKFRELIKKRYIIIDFKFENEGSKIIHKL